MHGLYPGVHLSSVPRPELGLGATPLLMTPLVVSLSSLFSPSRDYVQYWAQRGVEVVGWTVNTALEKQFYQEALKISYITDSLMEDCDY